MAGSFSFDFLKLNTNSNAKKENGGMNGAKNGANGETNGGGDGVKLKENVLEKESGEGDAEVHVDENDDEWYDYTTSEDNSPVRKRKDCADLSSVVSVRPRPLAAMVGELLHQMPSLFDAELPPCNADIQIAYQLVNNRLREKWIYYRGRRSLLEVCQAVAKDLREQQFYWPVETQKGQLLKNRKHWCRENVFAYQLRWMDYFIREAKATCMIAALMTESELIEKKERLPVVPPELRFKQLDRRIPEYVLELWRAWNEKKRSGTPCGPTVVVAGEHGTETVGMRGGGTGEDMEDVDLTADGRKSNVEPPMPPPTPNGGGQSDAYIWSDGGHD